MYAGETPPPAAPLPGGEPTPEPVGTPPPPARSDTNLYIILGFVFAVLGIGCCPFGLASIVMGIIANNKGNKLGMWVIVAGVVSVILAMGFNIFALRRMGPGGPFAPTTPYTPR
jgi:hypothetical protein